MLAKTLPLLALCACASTMPQPAPIQPELAQLAQPYANELRAVGITRLMTAGSGALVRLDTLSGAVYLRYPKDVPSLAFVLDVAPDGLTAASIAFDRARDAPVLDVLLPEAIRAAASNNAIMWIRSNPEN
jgi:hypothetical protein